MKKIQNTMFFCFMLLHVCINGSPGGWGEWNYGDQNGGYNNFGAPATGSNGWGYGNTNAGGYGGASNGWGYGDQPYAGSHGYSSYWAPAAGDEDSFSNQFSNLLPADPYAHYGNIPHNSGHSHLYSQNNSAHGGGGGGGGYATYPTSYPTNNNPIDRRPVHTPPAADQQRKQHHSSGPSAAGGHDEQSSDESGHDEQSSDKSGNSKAKHMQQSTTNKQQSSTSSHGEEKMNKSFSFRNSFKNLLPGIVASKSNESSKIKKGICSICGKKIEEGQKKSKLPCNHKFHKKCYADNVLNKPTGPYECPDCGDIL